MELKLQLWETFLLISQGELKLHTTPGDKFTAIPIKQENIFVETLFLKFKKKNKIIQHQFLESYWKKFMLLKESEATSENLFPI